MDQTLNQYWEPIKSVERLDESLFLLASNKGKDYPIHFLFNLFKFGHFRLIYFCFFPTLLIIFLLLIYFLSASIRLGSHYAIFQNKNIYKTTKFNISWVLFFFQTLVLKINALCYKRKSKCINALIYPLFSR